MKPLKLNSRLPQCFTWSSWCLHSPFQVPKFLWIFWPDCSCSFAHSTNRLYFCYSPKLASNWTWSCWRPRPTRKYPQRLTWPNWAKVDFFCTRARTFEKVVHSGCLFHKMSNSYGRPTKIILKDKLPSSILEYLFVLRCETWTILAKFVDALGHSDDVAIEIDDGQAHLHSNLVSKRSISNSLSIPMIWCDIRFVCPLPCWIVRPDRHPQCWHFAMILQHGQQCLCLLNKPIRIQRNRSISNIPNKSCGIFLHFSAAASASSSKQSGVTSNSLATK